MSLPAFPTRIDKLTELFSSNSSSSGKKSRKRAYRQRDEEAGEEVPERVEEGRDDGRQREAGRAGDRHDPVVREDEERQEHHRRIFKELDCKARKRRKGL